MIRFLIVCGLLCITVVFPVTAWFRFEHALYFVVLGVVMLIVGLLMTLGQLMV